MNKQEAIIILDQVYAKIHQEGHISNEIYAILLSFFPTFLSQALEILDHGKVQKIICMDSKRFFYRVKEPNKNKGNSFGSSSSSTKSDKDEYYDVMGDFCMSFFYQRECLNENGSAFYDKYVLAAKLGEALGIMSVQQIEDRDFAPLFLASARHLIKYEDNKKRN